MQEIWFLGDAFLKDIYSTFTTMHLEVCRNGNNELLYLASNYELKSFWKSATTIKSPSARFINGLIDAINGVTFLPHMIVIMTDTDVLKGMTYYGFGSSLIIGKVMDHLVNTITSIIDDHKDRMKRLKIGSIHPDEPCMVWLSLLSRPHCEKMLSLKRKYNEVLEETLTPHNNTYFLDVEGAIKPYKFHRNNLLTCDGKVSLWHFIDQMLKRFDHDQIGHEARKVIMEAISRKIMVHPAATSASKRIL